ncbi:MAG: hypothetical protein NC306_15340 [Butyrivibrio sp.]|nr:hypothetical protein [Butyrivibrio sp.]MCM1342680.1 hypothetical protein [Muribaculaceae bacterium]
MKKNTKPTDKKRTFAICGLSALCLAVLAGAWFLTREPETEFSPASTEVSDRTDTWEDHSAVDTGLPSAVTRESSQVQGTSSDNTQTVISEDETGSTTSLSDSATKEDALQEKPSEPPVTTDDITDPDRQPEYDPPAQTQTPASPQDNPSGGSGTGTPSGDTGSGDSHPGQVYDPVFGWVTPSSVQQDNIDSDGDINKQIGTMGGN